MENMRSVENIQVKRNFKNSYDCWLGMVPTLKYSLSIVVPPSFTLVRSKHQKCLQTLQTPEIRGGLRELNSIHPPTLHLFGLVREMGTEGMWEWWIVTREIVEGIPGIEVLVAEGTAASSGRTKTWTTDLNLQVVFTPLINTSPPWVSTWINVLHSICMCE